MKFLSPRRAWGPWVLFGILLALVVSGCTPDASAEIISPQLGEQLAAKQAGAEIVVQPTPEPVAISELSDEEILAGLPDDFRAALESADPSSGETLSLANGCVGCHALDPAVTMTGPTWYHIADIAANRREGVSPGLYLYNSIVMPNSFIVADYPSNIMPQNYSDILSAEDIADIVSYLLEQHE